MNTLGIDHRVYRSLVYSVKRFVMAGFKTSEKQLVSIIPLFNNNVIHLISGDVGPFRAGLPVRIPLWFAIELKQQKRCKIQPPSWMDVEQLEILREDEKQSATFIKMPSEHYMTEAKLLLSSASDDIPRADEIRTIIKDIWDVRMSKLRSSVDILVKNDDTFAALDHLTIMEINSIRPLVPDALNQLQKLQSNEDSSRLMSDSTLSSDTNTLSSR